MTQELVRIDPTKLVTSYQQGFSRLLPSHMREDGGGDQWVAAVKSLLATNPAIAAAASNSRDHFLASLIQAAQKGLMPGTKEFHLVPFSPKKGMPRIIQGVEGYQGIVERIYRAGAVSTVIAEAVYSNDQFEYQPGQGQPTHVVDWFGDRGTLKGAYAYAVFRDGAVSKVVMISPKEVAQAKAKSASAHSDYSPWNQFPEAMWVKTAVRKLENWVPTSAEYRRQQLRDVQAVQDERQRDLQIAQQLSEAPAMPAAAVAMAHDEDEAIDPETGEVIVDAELVQERGVDGGEDPAVHVPNGHSREADDQAAEVPSPRSASAAAPQTRPAPRGGNAGDVSPAAVDGEAAADFPAAAASAPIQQHQPEPEPEVSAPVYTPAPIRASQKPKLREQCIRLEIQANAAEKFMWFDMILGLDEPLQQVEQLNSAQAQTLIDRLAGFTDHAALEAWGAQQQSLLDQEG